MWTNKYMALMTQGDPCVYLAGMIQGGVDPTPRPLTDLHGVRRSTFKYKKMPAVIMQGLGLKP